MAKNIPKPNVNKILFLTEDFLAEFVVIGFRSFHKNKLKV